MMEVDVLIVRGVPPIMGSKNNIQNKDLILF
jgi:hypothetical protein